MLLHDIQAEWAEYKRGTKKIKDYLVAEGRHSPAEFRNAENISADKLVMLATRMTKKPVELTDDMAYLFRDTIGRRAYVTAHYVNQVEAGRKSERTSAHEHFIDT